MTAPPVVAFRDVTKRFGSAAAVDGVSFDLARGECVALLGPSGCGKTTTLRILAGFERIDDGVVRIDGRDMRGVPTFERPIGLVFQDYALFPHMTVAGNVEYGLKRRGIARGERAARRAEVLALVRLSGLEGRRPAELSGGQQQRVALARALAPRPALLLLDEPLSNLDARLRHDLREELRAILERAGTTTLMVTHDQEEAIAMSDRIVLMNAGRVEQVGTPAMLYGRPATRFAATFLGLCNWIVGERTGADAFRAVNGTVFATAVGKTAPGPAGLAIRPERIRLGEGGSGANRLAARVARTRFLGPDVRIDVVVDGLALEAVAKADGRPLPAAGDTLTVTIDPDACVIVPDGAAA